MKRIALMSSAVLVPFAWGQTVSPTAPVHVARVVEQKVASTVELVGTVMPSRRSVVACGGEGLVIALGEVEDVGGTSRVKREIREGDAVEKGEVLAQLRTRTLRIQEDAARAALEVAQHELNELKERLGPDEQRARAALAIGHAKDKAARAKYQRLERLVERNAASGEDLDEASGLAAMASEDVTRLKVEYELAKSNSGPLTERVRQAEAKVESALAALSRTQDELEKCTVRAPFDGFVVAKYTEVGQWLSNNSPVFELVELKEVDVQVMVPERYIHELRMGRAANVRIEALGEQVFQGEIFRVVPQADTRSRLFPVRIRIPNTMQSDHRPLLQAGMFGAARLPLGARHVATLVPKDALVLQAGKSVVFVVQTNGNGHAVTAVSVKPASAHDSLVEVEGSLKAGQLVVVRGNERLADGQLVQLESRVEDEVTIEPLNR